MNTLIHAVQALEIFDHLEYLGCVKRGMSFEGVKHNILEHFGERHVAGFSKSFQDFDQAFFHANTKLYPFDRYGVLVGEYSCANS